MPGMNWRRGLFRIWVIASLCWVVGSFIPHSSDDISIFATSATNLID
jgi:hypothetical protein